MTCSASGEKRAIYRVDPSAIRLLKTVWLLSADASASQVGLFIRQALRRTDPVVVVDATHDGIALWINPDVLADVGRKWNPPGPVIELPV